ncbi:MAG: UDP-N-acetylglucosamine--N-acetylmuramyl-(pentapeptide) pyrophosphoryl-undecaprenol N-acetylglucosamine transferase [Planctomycetota bacterium]|nr:UDP-N-acetylglucosamine--N-acetylmuramyl-(pentapeptide) pyrophosphoryl-undecaprenol N-acetylglucosamine transferase [Planctomycetota bacterium]
MVFEKNEGLRVLFAGGGTGGHICPAMAVVEALKERDPKTEVLFLGTGRAVERKLLEGAGLPYEVAAPTRMDRRLRSLPGLLGGAAKGLAKAFSAIKRFRPHVVLGLGGYGQVPGVVAARLLNIPYALFEPNRVPGRANRLLSGGAKDIYIQWAGTETMLRKPERAVRTGTPVRKQALATLSQDEARRELGLPLSKPVLLIVGGSQGAKPLNDWAEQVFETVRRPRFSIIHLAGSGDSARSLNRVYERAGVAHAVFPFRADMGPLYAASDLVFCRAGGATLAEVTAAGLPSIAVPYPHAVDDHQRANARSLGAGALIREQTDLGMGTFDEIAECLSTGRQLEELARHSRAIGCPDAAMEVAKRLEMLAGVTSASV